MARVQAPSLGRHFAVESGPWRKKLTLRGSFKISIQGFSMPLLGPRYEVTSLRNFNAIQCALQKSLLEIRALENESFILQ